MTIGTKHHAFIQFASDFVPAPGVPLARNTKVFLRRITMMKFQSFHAATVSALLAFAPLILNSHATNLLPSCMDSSYKILFAIAVFPLVFPHQMPCCPLHSFATLTRAQPHALPAELQGNNMLKNDGIAFGGNNYKDCGLGVNECFWPLLSAFQLIYFLPVVRHSSTLASGDTFHV